MAGIKILIHTLGCKVNQYDAEWLREQLRQAGHEVLPSSDHTTVPDVCIANTCAVTGEGERKSRQLVRRLARRYPHAALVVMGCSVTRQPEVFAHLPNVQAVVTPQELAQLPQLIQELIAAENLKSQISDFRFPIQNPKSKIQNEEIQNVPQSQSRTRALLKVQDGCNQYCAYCVVPFTRGAPRSRELAEVVAEARQLLRTGHRDIVLCGVRLGFYGRSLEPRTDLSALIESSADCPAGFPPAGEHAPAQAAAEWRLRLSSIEPNDVTPELLACWGRCAPLMPHVHLPLQAGCDATLERMGRKYTVAEYRAVVAQLRAAHPWMEISTDLMVGFPGETEEEAELTRQTLEEIGFCKIHLFPFSVRSGTRAATMPDHIPAPIIAQRMAVLAQVAAQSARRVHEKYLGATLPVLWEERSRKAPDYLVGYTPNYLRVGIPYPATAPDLINHVSPTRLTALGPLFIIGELK